MTAAPPLPPAARKFLHGLQVQALSYALDNQTPSGLILDRQSNHGPRRGHGLCSTAATGMGMISLALASAEPYHLLPHSDAVARVRHTLEGARDRLPHTHGVLPHFVEAASGAVVGIDQRSTIDTAWFVAGGLWAATFLRDPGLERLAGDLYGRIDWHYWTAPAQGSGHRSQGSGDRGKESTDALRSSDCRSPTPDPCFLTPDSCSLTPDPWDGAGLLRHAQDGRGHFLPSCWDRLNGETVFMYVLAAGADGPHAWPVGAWPRLGTFAGRVAGFRFGNADLGLFVFQYGLDLLDLRRWREPGGVDLAGEAVLAAEANYRCCRGLSEHFATFRHYWGLSAGDGPGEADAGDIYRCYAPSGPIDGTAHVTASLASVAQAPSLVWENLWQAQSDRTLAARGRYGFSNLNHDLRWAGRDMVGIDAGAAVLAVDNYLMGQRVRQVFHQIGWVQEGLQRLRFRPTAAATDAGETEPLCRKAS
jgi:hypothetical protein